MLSLGKFLVVLSFKEGDGIILPVVVSFSENLLRLLNYPWFTSGFSGGGGGKLAKILTSKAFGFLTLKNKKTDYLHLFYVK